MATSSIMTSAPWQSYKTIIECNRYMLEKELYTDVTFLVGEKETKVKEIKAHSYILMSRSPVFEAMLNGEWKAIGPIKIPDTDWKTFKAFLRYLYYEEYPEDSSSLFPLLYLATKYIIPALEQKCVERLKEEISIANVCIILEQSLFYGKTELTNDCMAFIRTKVKNIVKQETFLVISENTLKFILEDDKLFISETEVFESCISWGKAKCVVDGRPDTGKNIRKALGDALNSIRFPTMPAKFLADRVSPMDILSKSEMLELLLFTAVTHTENNTQFKSKQRIGNSGVLCCERFEAFGKRKLWGNSGQPDAIAFRTNEDIHFIGIKVSVSEDKDVTHSISVKLYERDTCLGSVSCLAPGGPQQKEIYFTEGINLNKHVMYDVVLTMRGRAICQVRSGKSEVICHGVRFLFSHSRWDQCGTSVLGGQIPCILFATKAI